MGAIIFIATALLTISILTWIDIFEEPVEEDADPSAYWW